MASLSKDYSRLPIFSLNDFVSQQDGVLVHYLHHTNGAII